MRDTAQRLVRLGCVVALLGSLLSAPVLLPQPVEAAGPTITVDRTDDTAAATACTGSTNDCSLRGAVIFANANPGTTILATSR